MDQTLGGFGDALLARAGEPRLTEVLAAGPDWAGARAEAVQDRSEAEAPANQAGLLPPVEIRAAATRVLAESGETPRDELIVATARLLGFARVGAELRGVIDAALMEMEQRQG